MGFRSHSGLAGSLLLKYHPGLIPKKYRNLRHILALSGYALWDLKRQGIPARLFSDLCPFSSLQKFHRELSELFDSCCYDQIESPLSYSQLFKNHLCWEVQTAYFVLRVLDSVVKRFRIRRIIVDPLPIPAGKRYSKNINELIALYCQHREIAFEKYKN